MNKSVAAASVDVGLLDNPIWNSLRTGHARFAVGGGLARRYAAEVGPLSGLQEPSAEAFAELAAIVPEGDVAVLFLEERIELPARWELVRDGTLVQMICTAVPEEAELAERIEPLGPEDVAEMVALATLTEPGPFRDGTPSLGGFLGVRVDGRLAAMAGQRLSPTGFAEVSAVCTHPDFRGRGFARALVAAVARDIYAAGSVPFLTSFEGNTGAIHVYEQVGFAIRRRFELAVLRLRAIG
jgi:ribosomal protein S18 acetylase RimI-like enzyme